MRLWRRADLPTAWPSMPNVLPEFASRNWWTRLNEVGSERMNRNEQEPKKPLTLSRPGRLELKKTVEAGQVRQSFPHGRSKNVTVEVKRQRTYDPGDRQSTRLNSRQ